MVYENEHLEKLKKLEKTKRVRISITVVSALIGFPLIIYATLNKAYATKVDPDFPVFLFFGFLFLAFGILHTIFWYLQTGFKDQQNIDMKDEEIRGLHAYYAGHANDDLKNIKAEVQTLKDALTSGAKSKLTEELIEAVKDGAHETLLSELNEKLSSENLSASVIDEIKSSERRSTLRIEMEIDALSRRGNINLVAGVGTAMIGIGILSSFIFPENLILLKFLINYTPDATSNLPDSQLDQTLRYATRTALIISIEILAFFFLRVYKSNLEGMKYFQNELTNLESKYISLITATQLERHDTTHKILLNFVETERNHILEKGQSTTELKKIELEKNQFVEITKALATITPKTK